MPRYLQHGMLALMAALLAFPVMAAPQFGKLEVRSKLGQPLVAAIPVSGLDGQPFEVAIASSADHQRYGMELPLLPDDATVALGPQRKGVREILLTTGLPANEPVLSMVLRFTNGSSAGTRVFTALVNPDRPRALALRKSRRAERRASVLAAVPGVQDGDGGATATAPANTGVPATEPRATRTRVAAPETPRAPARATSRSGRAPITRANVRERLAELTAKVEQDARERAELKATNKDLSARMKAMGERLARMQASLKKQDERLEAMRMGLKSINEKIAAAPQLALVGGAVASASAGAVGSSAPSQAATGATPGTNTTAPAAGGATTVAATPAAQASLGGSADLFGFLDSSVLTMVALALGGLLLFGVLFVLLLRLNKRKSRRRRSTDHEAQEREAREAMSRKAAIQAAPALAEPSTFKVSPDPIEELTLESNSDSMFGEPVSAIPTSGGPPPGATATAADEVAALLAEVDVRVAFGDADVAERLLADGLQRYPGESQLEERLARLRAENGAAASDDDDDDWISGPDDDPFDWGSSDDDSNVLPFARRG